MDGLSMDVLSKDDRARMSAAVAHVRELLESAEFAAMAYELPKVAFPVWGAVLDFFETAEADITHNTRQARANFDDWSTARVAWVERGTGSEGLRYTLQMWMDQGKALASQLKDADLGGIFEASAAGAVFHASVATVEDVAALPGKVVDKVTDAAKRAADELAKPWSLGTKVALWGVGGALVLGAAGYGVRAFR